MFWVVHFALLGLALAGPVDIEADLKHNVDIGRLQKVFAALDERLKNTAAVEAEIELLKAAYAKTVIDSPAPLNGSTIEDEDANKLNEKADDYLIEGDMLLTNEQLGIIETPHKSNRSRRQALKDDKYSWGTVNPVIPYSYSATYPKEIRGPIITAAMRFWEKNTCVRFKEVTSGYRVEIRDEGVNDRCISMVGKDNPSSGMQELNLGEHCITLQTITHELMHTFGFSHVQSRFDRDQYIDIDFSNIETVDKWIFDIRGKDKTVLHDIPYEFGSVMHYTDKAAAKDSSKPVIHAKPAYKIYQESMGGRAPTFYDILAVNKHFNCAAKCNTSVDCENGGVQDVNNCNKCRCPLGWTGSKCKKRPTHKKLRANFELEKLSIDMLAVNKTKEYKDKYYLIRAPPGMKVQMTPKALGYHWSSSCKHMGIEVKFLKDQRHAGLHVCDWRVQYPKITSETNEMLVQAYTLGGDFSAELLYKAVHAPEKCDTFVACDNGGVQDVDNCNKCICPFGWTGDMCDHRPIHSKLLARGKYTTMTINMTAGTETTEYYLIKAPTGMKVQMTPKVLAGRWSHSCDQMGIEVKSPKKPRQVGPRVCDWRFQQPTIVSETNEMLVQAYADDQFAVELQYKAVKSIEKCKTSIACDNGGLEDVNNCNKCICPLGWTGDTCDQRPIHSNLLAKGRITNMTISVDDESYAEYKIKYYLIKAPTGMRVQMTSKVRYGLWSSDNSCPKTGMEVKFLKDPRSARRMVCDPRMEQLPTITSETNEMFIEAFTQDGIFEVDVQYKAVIYCVAVLDELAKMSLCEASDDLKQKYLSRVPKSEVADGFIFSGHLTSHKKLLSLADEEFGPDDIVIASYPKSGSTPVSEIVSAIAHEGNFKVINSIPLGRRVPWMELDMGVQQPAANKTAAKKRVCFTHVNAELLPKSVLAGKGKLIYVVKNPKDTALAYFHYHHTAKFLKNEIDLSWEEYFPLFCSGHICYGSWFKHVAAYWKLGQIHDNVKFVYFEDMKKDLAATVEEIEKFVGVPLTEEQRLTIVDHCSKLTNREDVQLDDAAVAQFQEKGADWKNYFSVAQNEAFDALYKKELEGIELNFN